MINLKMLAYAFRKYAEESGLTEREMDRDLLTFMSGAIAALTTMGYDEDSQYILNVVEHVYRKRGFAACKQDIESYEREQGHEPS